MHWFGIALLALVLGFVYSWIQPNIAKLIPASAQGNMVVNTFLTGAIILVGVFLSVFLLSIIGIKSVRE